MVKGVDFVWGWLQPIVIIPEQFPDCQRLFFVDHGEPISFEGDGLRKQALRMMAIGTKTAMDAPIAFMTANDGAGSIFGS